MVSNACRYAVSLPAGLVLAAIAMGADDAIPITDGNPVAGLESFDREMTQFMQARDIPGGALAVSRGGRIVLSRGYGWADKDAGEQVQPTSLFRIASLSKPITAVAMMQLIERSHGEVSLDTPALALLDIEPHVAEGQEVDPRLGRITIRHLLQHTAGWDRDVAFDPMFIPGAVAATLGTEPPAGPREVIAFTLGYPLDFDPGGRHCYSNFGYCILGRIIETLSGKTYEQYVKQEVLAPVGIASMQIGRTLPRFRAQGEVRYYDANMGDNVMVADAEEAVPAPYGTFHLEAMDAHGGWIASAEDLVRFACAFDDPGHCPLLSQDSIDAMFARPASPLWCDEEGKPGDYYYACGWQVRPTPDGKANHWHAGSLPGTCTLLVRRHDGLNWAVLFNQREDPSGLSYWDIDPALHRAANAVTRWP